MCFPRPPLESPSCQGQTFRPKFPLPQRLEDSFCFLEKALFLSVARGTGGPSINLWLWYLLTCKGQCYFPQSLNTSHASTHTPLFSHLIFCAIVENKMHSPFSIKWQLSRFTVCSCQPPPSPGVHTFSLGPEPFIPIAWKMVQTVQKETLGKKWKFLHTLQVRTLCVTHLLNWMLKVLFFSQFTL